MNGAIIKRTSADEILLFNPGTGEQIDLRAEPTETLAALRERIRENEQDERLAKEALDRELHDRMARENTLTLHVDGFKLVGTAATETQWDVDRLRAALESLVEQGALSEAAAKRAVKSEVVHKPVAGELGKLAKRDDVVGEMVRGCRSVVPAARRRVMVKATTAPDTERQHG